MEKVMISIIVFFLLIFLFMMLVAAPYSMYAEKQCLEAGYPNTNITYDFDIYCSTLDGDVSIKLEKL